MTPRHPRPADPVPQPLELTDPLAAQAAEAVGGPLGRFAGLARRGWAGAASVLVALASVSVALGVVQKSHCVQHGFTAPSYFWRACFSDLPLLYAGSPLRESTPPYLGAHLSGQVDGGYALQEPILNGLAMWLVSLVTPAGAGDSLVAQHAWYFGLWAVLGMLLLSGAVLAATWGRPGDAWRASHLAISPIIITAGLVSPDLLGVALVTLGLAAWYRERLGLAGIALGLGLLSGLYAVFFVLGIVMVAGRAGRLAEGITVAAYSGVTAVLAALPVMVLGPPKDLFALGLHPRNAIPAYEAWDKRAATYGSLWKGLQPAIGNLAPGHLSLLGWLGVIWAVLVGAILAFGLKRQVGLTPVVLSMILVASLTGKEMPVQQALWLLPLVVFSGIPWRDHLVWATTEVLHFVAVWMHATYDPANPSSKALDGGWYGLFVVLRMAGIGYLLWSALHHARPELEEDEVLPTWDQERHADFLDAAPRAAGQA